MPTSPAEPSDEFVATVGAIISEHAGQRGPLIEILHDVQACFGFIPHAAVPLIAEGLNLSRAEVQGVIGFYHDFRTSPPGAATVQICRAEACQAMGVRQLEAHVKQRLGIDYHQTTADGRFTPGAGLLPGQLRLHAVHPRGR